MLVDCGVASRLVNLSELYNTRRFTTTLIILISITDSIYM